MYMCVDSRICGRTFSNPFHVDDADIRSIEARLKDFATQVEDVCYHMIASLGSCCESPNTDMPTETRSQQEVDPTLGCGDGSWNSAFVRFVVSDYTSTQDRALGPTNIETAFQRLE